MYLNIAGLPITEPRQISPCMTQIAARLTITHLHEQLASQYDQ
jgi:hypothetical protein